MDITTVQALSALAMVFAITGSGLMVHKRYEEGAKAFLLGNTINIMVALGVGDVAFLASQAALAAYTLPMYKSKSFSAFLIGMAIVLLWAVGISSGFHFTLDPVSGVGAVLAIIGARAMYKGQFNLMGWMWIIADPMFIYVGLQHGLTGLVLQSAVFTWHGVLRVTGMKQTGIFTFTKA